MKFPSKITSYGESVISKFPQILSLLQNSDTSVFALYEATMEKYSDVEEFIDALDCLFALRIIRYDAEREVICYVA